MTNSIEGLKEAFCRMSNLLDDYELTKLNVMHEECLLLRRALKFGYVPGFGGWEEVAGAWHSIDTTRLPESARAIVEVLRLCVRDLFQAMSDPASDHRVWTGIDALEVLLMQTTRIDTMLPIVEGAVPLEEICRHCEQIKSLESTDSLVKWYVDWLQKLIDQLEYLEGHIRSGSTNVNPLKDVVSHVFSGAAPPIATLSDAPSANFANYHARIQRLVAAKLAEFDLTLIEPLPGEDFNGRLHEVFNEPMVKSGKIVVVVYKGIAKHSSTVLKAQVLVDGALSLSVL